MEAYSNHANINTLGQHQATQLQSSYVSIQLADTMRHVCKIHCALLDMGAEALHQICGSITDKCNIIATKPFIWSICHMHHWVRVTFWTRYKQDITGVLKPYISNETVFPATMHTFKIYIAGVALVEAPPWQLTTQLGGGGVGWGCGWHLMRDNWHCHCNPLNINFILYRFWCL